MALVGAPFRLHGRDPATGLDCIGVMAVALQAAGWRGAVPRGYPLRGGDPVTIAARLDAMLATASGAAAGDVLLFHVGPGQLHGAVRTTAGIVHADARLRRVVARPGMPAWPMIGAWCYEGDD